MEQTTLELDTITFNDRNRPGEEDTEPSNYLGAVELIVKARDGREGLITVRVFRDKPYLDFQVPISAHTRKEVAGKKYLDGRQSLELAKSTRGRRLARARIQEHLKISIPAE